MDSIKVQIINEIYRPARRNYQRRKVQIKGYDDLFEADLVEMIPYAKENKNYKYILTVINCYSRFAWALPVKKKTGVDITEAMQKVFNKQTPKNLHTDSGKEFFNHHFQSLSKELGINHYTTHSGLKASMVERFNRTLKTNMWKKFAIQGNYKWLNMLPTLVTEYNHKTHSTIGMKPQEVGPLTLLDPHSRRRIKSKPPQFKVNDHVRISKNKHVFAKGYQGNFSTEIFRVVEVRKTLPTTYILEDASNQHIVGSFYEPELTSVKYSDSYLVEKIVRRKGDKALVKWLGMKEQTWEDLKKMKLV